MAEFGYFGRPLLKTPVWTWEIPLYLFVGGIAGAAAVIGLMAGWVGGDAGIARDARWIAAGGALISPVLLISDLGRPARFLNMLRVFKKQSAMSVGAWTLVMFSAAAFSALALHWWRTPASPTVMTMLGGVADLATGLLGLVLATYTGVLLTVTAVPVWAAHTRTLPLHFGASSLGAAASLLELIGHRTSALNLIAGSAAAIETALWTLTELRRRPLARPLVAGGSGWLVRAAALLTGPAPLALRLLTAPGSTRLAAAVCQVAGSLSSRIAWLVAGRRSTADPRAALLAVMAMIAAGTGLHAASGPQPSASTIVKRASTYVAAYEKQLAFVVADETTVQAAAGEGARGGPGARVTHGEIFLTFVPGDQVWIAIHDIAEVDGRMVPDREDLRPLLQRGEVSRTARLIADRNARFNIGRITRNFNEPTLGLLFLEPQRAAGVSFHLDRIERDHDTAIATISFVERERPTLIRGERGEMVFARGEMDVEVDTGRLRRTRIAFASGPTTAELATEYAWNENIGLWVPIRLTERYERKTPAELVTCESTYTNYRRFEVTVRIK